MKDTDIRSNHKTLRFGVNDNGTMDHNQHEPQRTKKMEKEVKKKKKALSRDYKKKKKKRDM